MSSSNTSLVDSPLFKALLTLEMPVEDYAVFGSGPLLAHGFKTDVHDLDVIARGRAWATAQHFGQPVPSPSGYGSMIELSAGSLQIFDAWTSPEWDIDQLIDESDLIASVRFVSLLEVLRWKVHANREKDADDIALLRRLLFPSSTDR